MQARGSQQLEAVRRGNADEAEALTRAHLHFIRDSITEVLGGATAAVER